MLLVPIDQIMGGGRLFGLTSKSVDRFIYCYFLNKFRNYFGITFAYYQVFLKILNKEL